MMRLQAHTTIGASGLVWSRRRVMASLAGTLGTYGIAEAAEHPIVRALKLRRAAGPVPDVLEEVIPKAGQSIGVLFHDALQKLVAAGVIDPDKFRGSANDLPPWVERLLRGPSSEPIVFDRATAPHLVNLLWPIGMANRVPFNDLSKINTLRIPTFASTGGWRAGRQDGFRYFNRVEAVRLTPEQQAMVLRAAMTTYRPCCDNSTFFQDCNHGSALLGLFELAAAQGATLDRLYRLGLTANAYWFPEHYAKTALYFSHYYGKPWHEVDPRYVLSATFSSASGWQKNVAYSLMRANIMLPGAIAGQQGC